MIDVAKLLANYAAKFPDGMIRDQHIYGGGCPATLGKRPVQLPDGKIRDQHSYVDGGGCSATLRQYGAIVDGDATLIIEE